jgi:hypothetical protein
MYSEKCRFSCQELEYGLRFLAELNAASVQFIGEIHGHIAGPALSGVEGDDADRTPILAFH